MTPQDMDRPPLGLGVTDLDTIKNPFEYIPAPEHTADFKAITAAATILYDEILDHCPQSAERTLAIRKLQEARMWANSAIAFNGRRYLL